MMVRDLFLLCNSIKKFQDPYIITKELEDLFFVNDIFKKQNQIRLIKALLAKDSLGPQFEPLSIWTTWV